MIGPGCFALVDGQPLPRYLMATFPPSPGGSDPIAPGDESRHGGKHHIPLGFRPFP